MFVFFGVIACWFRVLGFRVLMFQGLGFRVWGFGQASGTPGVWSRV